MIEWSLAGCPINPDTWENAALGQDTENTPSDLPQELNCFFISAGRHDRDRIELQFGFDGLIQSNAKDFEYDVDFVLFVPKSLGLTELEELSQLRNEFQSYVRLHSHVTNPNSETSRSRVEDRLNQLKSQISLENLRLFAIEFEGLLKAHTKKAKKKLYPTLDHELNELNQIHNLVDDFRAILSARSLMGKDADEFPRGDINHDLLLLNEYLSHLYVQYLVEIYFSARLDPAAKQIMILVEQFALTEASLRQAFHYLLEQRNGPNSSEDEELYPRRISILKKYFQKTLFVSSTGTSIQRRALIPVYGISAALAASWAIMIQLYQARSMTDRLGINSIAILVVGVLAYVAKDIMKDFFRRYFFQTSHRWFPDYEKTLFIQKNNATSQLGSIKEYLRWFDSEKLPEDLKKARYSNRGGEIEESLHEDILHFKKHVTLNLKQLETSNEFPWGFREIVRYRFDRFVTSMEDPFKNLSLLSRSGMPASRRAHRVYHIYMAAWIRSHNPAGELQESPVKPAFKAFRISLDKTGVLTCESVKWKKLFGIPQTPA